MTIDSRQFLVSGLLIAFVACFSCQSLIWTGTHDGIRYSIHRDNRTHAIVKGQDGSLMYDSPELVVLCEAGRLKINGEACGTVSEGDLVAITEMGTVLVNGQRRGDSLTGREQMQQRLRQAKTFTETHSDAELELKSRRDSG